MIEAVLVANMHARRSAGLIARAHTLLERRGIRIVSAHFGRNGKEVRSLVRDAIAGGAPRVIVGGGDGTMTRAVGAFAHMPAILGVLPLGTGNSFALSLGIENSLERAVDTIAGGRIAHVGLGVVNGTHFANFATIGLPSIISRATPPFLKDSFGPLAYALAGVGPFLRSRPFKCTVRWDGRKEKIWTHQIVIASGSCFGKRPLIPGKSILDGNLAFFTTLGGTRIDVARAYIAMYRGTNTELSDAFSFAAPEISIACRPKQKLDVDGAKLGKTTAHFSIDERALAVFVPEVFG